MFVGDDTNKYQMVPFPQGRRLITDIGWMARNKNTIRGLIEIDVTRPRQVLREHREKTGEKFSFTAYLTACAGKAIESNKYLHAYRDLLGRLVLYDDIDIASLIEVKNDGKTYPVGHIIRAANKKSFREIHTEIRAAQRNSMGDEGVQSLYVFRQLPGFLRRLVFLVIGKIPRLMKKYSGTVSLTAVGMFGNSGGWGIGLPSHTLGITVGGIATKPGIYKNRIEPREYLQVTLDFDHDIVDGAPAARFAQRFQELVESGVALCETITARNS
jgi:pyruvate/2-oxoglutarate dehydrogenase complex dihydrolipoamide acyltransferase (E2) component